MKCDKCKLCLYCRGLGLFISRPEFPVGIDIRYCGHCKGHGYK